MDRQKSYCAWVKGNVNDLDRGLLREEFSKFGRVVKIFIDADITYAKVYFENLEQLKRACQELDGFRSWAVTFNKDDYSKHKTAHLNLNNSLPPKPNSPYTRSLDVETTSLGSSALLEDMEEECTFADDYVDIHGRPSEVLEAENGQLYVNLDDVRRAGFNIFKKESYESAIISKDLYLREFENYLLNQGMKYLINRKINFNENEVLGTIEKVRAKLQNRNVESFNSETTAQFGEGRVINKSTNNFTITKNNVPSTSSDHIRPPKQYEDNIDRSIGQMKPTRGKEGRQDGVPNGYRQQNSSNRNEDRKNANENDVSFSDTAPPMRRPKQDPWNIRAKAAANSDANDEPEETWQGEKSVPSKSVVVSINQRKAQNDNSLNNSDKTKLSLERVMLPADSTIYKAKISYIQQKMDRKVLYYVQWMENMNTVDNILLHVNSFDLNNPDIAEPARDMLAVGFFDDCWYRVIVLQINQNNIFVELIDYGNKENITMPLKEMSAEMKKIPGQAIRVTLNNKPEQANFKLETDQEIELNVKKHYDDATHVIEVLRVCDPSMVDKDPATPKSTEDSDPEPQAKPALKKVESKDEDCFLEIPPTLGSVKNDELVLILGYKDNKLILRNKDGVHVCKRIYEHMLNTDKKPIKNLKVGQLVLCSRDGLEGLHRAVVKSIDGQVANIEYLDYFGEECLSVKSLRNINATLAKEPRSVIESPDYDILKKIDKSEVMIFDFISTRKKLRVAMNGTKFDLKLEDGSFLSKKIEELEKPHTVESLTLVEAARPVKTETKKEKSPAKRKEEPPAPPAANNVEPAAGSSQYVPVSFEDMPYTEAKLGMETFICYSCKGNTVTLISTSDDTMQYLEDIDVKDLDDTEPYGPEALEMCLAKFQDVWYRAIVADHDETNTYTVVFVDFGNEEQISKNDLRRLPKKLSEIPILGMTGRLLGIPADNSNINKRLQELIQDESVLDVMVKSDLDGNFQYGIEIPSIYETLKKEGLLEN